MEGIISTSKGTHLLSWHRRDSCIQWCLEWAVAWIEVTSEDVLLQASSTHSLSERTGALSFGGWNDADFSNMGKGCLIPVKHFSVCVEKGPMIFFKRLWNLDCTLSMDYFPTVCCCCCCSMDSNLCEPMQEMQSLVSILKRNCHLTWRIHFILGMINRAQKKACYEATSCCRHADSW